MGLRPGARTRNGRGARRGLLWRGLFVATLLAAPLATADAADAVQQTWVMTMTGRGYGHGVGMSQYGAQGFAKRGKTHKEILRHYYRGISFGTTGNRTVRVLLTSRQSPVRVTSAAAFTARVGPSTKTMAAGVVASVTRSSDRFRLVAGGRSWTSTTPIEFRPGASRLRLVNRNLNGWSTTANVRYRGRLTVAYSSSFGLCTINKVALESYLRGVVPREMPSSWHQQALRAQAVAARTFAAKRITSAGLFDLYCDTRSQAYSGADGETAPTTGAVSATRGVVATYNGGLIDAFYFSTSGGRTENCENVFWARLAYLRSVDDPYDYESPYHTWPSPLSWSGPALRKRIGTGHVPAGGLQALYVVQRGASPRVRKALAVSASGARAVTGASLRARLGLRDTWFSARSMSMVPGEGAKVAAGTRLRLRGRTYPALGGGATLKLSYYRDGRWRSVKVPSAAIERHTRKATADGRTYTLSYSTYSYWVRPPRTTTYRFVTGSARSPKMKVTVMGTAPAPTPAPTPTPTPSPTSTPTPSTPTPSPTATVTAEPSVAFTVGSTTVHPGDFFTLATRNFRINRGREAAFRYQVLYGPPAGGTYDGVTALVVFKVRDAAGASRLARTFTGVPVNTTRIHRTRCWLKPGSYTYHIRAWLPDGTAAQRVGEGRFIVRHEDGTMPSASRAATRTQPEAEGAAHAAAPQPAATPQPSAPTPSPSAAPTGQPADTDANGAPAVGDANAEPRAAALATCVVSRGQAAAPRVEVIRSQSGIADVVVKIRREGDTRTVKTLVLTGLEVGGEHRANFRCWLASGRYRYYAYAVGAGGVWQTAPSSRPFIVR